MFAPILQRVLRTLWVNGLPFCDPLITPSSSLQVSIRQILADLLLEVSWICMTKHRDVKIGPCLHNFKCYGQFASHWVGSNVSKFPSSTNMYDSFLAFTTIIVLKIKWYKYRLNIYYIYFIMTWVRNNIKKETEGILLKSL